MTAIPLPKSFVITAFLWLLTSPHHAVFGFQLVGGGGQRRQAGSKNAKNGLTSLDICSVTPERSEVSSSIFGSRRHRRPQRQQQHPRKFALQKVGPQQDENVSLWADKYTSVDALRETFGANQNKFWGDLQATTARRLYKTLLPRALLELSHVGNLDPQDLAPLAYQARLAAKMYARERSTVPLRVTATLFDGFRQWLKYGRFQANGMSYDQLWEKYAERIIQETENNEDLSQQVCQKILERACASNARVDSLVLQEGSLQQPEQQQGQQANHVLEKVHSQLQNDIYQLLLPLEKSDDSDDTTTTATTDDMVLDWTEGGIFRDSNHFKTLRLAAAARRKLSASSRARVFRQPRKNFVLDRTTPLWVDRSKRY